MQKTKNSSKNLAIESKIEHVLDELRVVLPGTQALLGFQLTAFFSQGFEEISTHLQYLHLISLGFIALSTVLLMAPVAYHQIVEDGEDTKRLHGFSSKLLVFTLVFLALGLAADIYVVTSVTTNSSQIALIASAALLVVSYTLWFGYTLLKRKIK